MDSSMITFLAGMEERDRDSVIGLMIACLTEHIPTIRLFLRADVNELFLGETPLMRMARHGNLDVVSILVAYGANIDMLDENGCSALAIGVRNSGRSNPSSSPKNHYGMCEFLIAMGASRDIKLTQADIIHVAPDVADLLRTPLSLQRICHYRTHVQSLKP